MNKPDWDHAPDWANYLAQDRSGRWYWYEKRPYADDNEWITESGLIQEIELDPNHPGWKDTLEKRPN